MKFPYRVLGLALALTANALLSSNTAAADAVFSASEIQAIQAYYRDHAGASRGGRELPPGIARNLGRGKPLPPGIAKQQLPAELSQSLPPVPNGYERAVIDGKILLIETATQIIADILTDALFH